MEKNLNLFKTQIQDDINIIKKEWDYVDENLIKDEYAFNYWILSRIYSLDEEIIPEYITEYNDKGVDCYVHYEENKELFLIQNKYYNVDTSVTRKEVSDFLGTPLATLKSNKYKKSNDLQDIFNKIKDDKEYKIYLHFYATTNKKSEDIDDLIKNFNNLDHGLACLVDSKYFGLSDLFELYYGKNYKENINFKFDLGTVNKGTFMSLREEYGIEGLYEAYYIITPVCEIYKMLLAAEKKEYSIFENNIREFLGKNSINTGIIETLRSTTERKNFMYYNNGITVICKAVKPCPQMTSGERKIQLYNPQIVNGCQTVSSIKNVLDNVGSNFEKEYKNVYVVLKTLVIKDYENEEDKRFYENVVRFTNKQNAISEKVFATNKNNDIFIRMQDEFFKRGFVLLVKPSDNYKYKEKLTRVEKADLVQKANVFIDNIDYGINTYSDICISLEKMLQVFLALIKTGYVAFTKKNLVLDANKEYYTKYCSNIHQYLTYDTMIKLYYFYKKAEHEQKKLSEDKRTPIPYYMIGFLGDLIGDKTPENLKESLDILFGDKTICTEAYKYLSTICKFYRNTYEMQHKADGTSDYNVMIKRPIDEVCLKFAINNADAVEGWENVKRWRKL